jgi:hypothetical protein
MDRIDVLIAHHSHPSFASPAPTDHAPQTSIRSFAAYVAARTIFWLTLGASAGFAYAYGWLVG